MLSGACPFLLLAQVTALALASATLEELPDGDDDGVDGAAGGHEIQGGVRAGHLSGPTAGAAAADSATSPPAAEAAAASDPEEAGRARRAKRWRRRLGVSEGLVRGVRGPGEGCSRAWRGVSEGLVRGVRGPGEVCPRAW